MTQTIIGWLLILAAALGLEGIGLAGWGGFIPLTHVVWTAEKENPSVASLIVILAVVGFPAWLVWHFLFQHHN